MAEIESRPRELSITERIVDMLAQNGNIDKTAKDKLLFEAIKEILHKLDDLDGLKKEVDELKKRNIATVFINHPIQSSVVTFIIFIVLNTIAHSISISAWTNAILQWLGFPVPPL